MAAENRIRGDKRVSDKSFAGSNLELKSDTINYFILFIVPGLLAHRVFGAFVVTRSHADDRDSVLTLGAVGACLFAFTLPLATWLQGIVGGSPGGDAVALFLSLAAWPVFAGSSAGLIVRSKKFSEFLQRTRMQSPHASAWDYFFSKCEPCFVRATLDDGSMIGGLWFADGFASSGLAGRDLYLDQQWQLADDGAFIASVSMSRGCWIDVSRVRHVEFFTIEELTTSQEGATDDERPLKT